MSDSEAPSGAGGGSGGDSDGGEAKAATPTAKGSATATEALAVLKGIDDKLVESSYAFPNGDRYAATPVPF